MIKAGSLFYSIVISVVMAIISGMCIMSFYLSDIEFQNCEMLQRVNQNADSGLNLLLADGLLNEQDEERSIDLFGKGTDFVKIKTIQWGAYEIAISKVKEKNISSFRVAMTGHSIDDSNLYSLHWQLRQFCYNVY